MATIRIEPWGPDDLPLVEKVMGDPRMTVHLGGPESPEKLAERQDRYAGIATTGRGRMFKVIDMVSGEGVGSVGYWDREEGGIAVWETGWNVIPEFQGRGIATEAMRLVIERARAERTHRWMDAYPAFDNHASNALCGKLGFELLGECDFEFPPGNLIHGYHWRLDLFGEDK